MTRPTLDPAVPAVPATAADATALLEGALRALEDAPARLAAVSASVQAGLADLERQVEADLLAADDDALGGVVDRLEGLEARASSGGVRVRLRADAGEVTGPDRPLRGGVQGRLLAHAETALRAARRDLAGRIAGAAGGVGPDDAARAADRAGTAARFAAHGVPADLPAQVGDALAGQWVDRLRGDTVSGEDPRHTVRVTLRGDGGLDVAGTPRARHVGHTRPLLAAVAAAYTDASRQWQARLAEVALTPPQPLPPDLRTALDRVAQIEDEQVVR